MWILPKSITSAFAPGMAALTSDCGDASQACEQSLMRRSKPSRASSFSREWRAGNLTRLRSGLISSPSLGTSFADWWTSSLAATRASHSQPPESASEEKTRDTSGRLSQAAFEFFSLESASLRTSKATLPKGSITSCLTWEDWVIAQRGEFSQRLNAARRTSASASSSWPTVTTTEAKSDTLQDRAARGKQVMLCHAVRQWPTPTANEDKDQSASWETLAQLDKGGRILRRIASMESGRPAPASPSLAGSRPELWPTATATNRVRDEETMAKCAAFRKTNANQNTVPLYLEERVLQEQAKSWATPEAKNQVGYQVGAEGTKWPRLGNQVTQWPTPASSTGSGGAHGLDVGSGARSMLPEEMQRSSGKLNPRWVETLMGLPVGWTMPSCPSPVTIAPTSCASSATESCPPPQSLPSAS